MFFKNDGKRGRDKCPLKYSPSASGFLLFRRQPACRALKMSDSYEWQGQQEEQRRHYLTLFILPTVRITLEAHAQEIESLIEVHDTGLAHVHCQAQVF